MRPESAVCLVTGATGGIGRALAAALAAAGAKLVLTGRDGEQLVSLAAALPAGSVRALHVGDLTDPAARQALADKATNAGANVLVNLAGANAFGLLGRQDPALAQSLLDTNLVAPVALTRLMLPHLLSLREAVIVNVGSTFGAIGYPGYAVYCASKFGLRGFSEALARELADGPVKVLYMAPRAVRTTMNSAAATALNAALGNREDPPERVVASIVRAISKQRRRAGSGWPEQLFARLNQLLPGLMDRALAGQLSTIKKFALRD